jgi:hypothetical protein
MAPQATQRSRHIYLPMIERSHRDAALHNHSVCERLLVARQLSSREWNVITHRAGSSCRPKPSVHHRWRDTVVPIIDWQRRGLLRHADKPCSYSACSLALLAGGQRYRRNSSFPAGAGQRSTTGTARPAGRATAHPPLSCPVFQGQRLTRRYRRDCATAGINHSGKTEHKRMATRRPPCRRSPRAGIGNEADAKLSYPSHPPPRPCAFILLS